MRVVAPTVSHLYPVTYDVVRGSWGHVIVQRGDAEGCNSERETFESR